MRRLTLTFDNGPAPGATDAVLDLLARRGYLAVFFVVGSQLQSSEGRRLVRRIADEGHLIGNHTMHHARPLAEYENLSDSVMEIAKLEECLDSLGLASRLFRPSGRGKIGPHLFTDDALDYLLLHAYTVVTWNNVPGDWLSPRRAWLENVFQLIESNSWNVVVLHDHCQGDMLDLLEAFLDRVEESGTQVRTDFPPDCLPVVKGELRVERSSISR